MLLNGLLILLSVIGFFIALYFTLVYYGKIPADHFLVPRVCRMDKSSCQIVLSTREARLFRIPNSLLGLHYYLLVIFMVLFGSSHRGSLASYFLFSLSIFTVLVGLYLIYSLLFKIKIPCPLCFVSNGINILIMILLLLKS